MCSFSVQLFVLEHLKIIDGRREIKDYLVTPSRKQFILKARGNNEEKAKLHRKIYVKILMTNHT